jgi:hypothetical protein
MLHTREVSPVPIHTIGLTFKTDAGTVPISNILFALDAEVNSAYLVPAGQTRNFGDSQFPFAKVNDYCITLLNSLGKAEATTGTVTANWNGGGGSPQMLLAAKKPVYFYPGSGTSNLFTQDVTSVDLINTGTTDVTVSIHVGLNT